MKKVILFLLVTASSQGAFAAERVLSCASSSHANYSAELFADRSLGYYLHLKVGGSLKYSASLTALPPDHVSMRSYKWSIFNRPVGSHSSLYFSKVRGTENEFSLRESTFAPPAFDEVVISFLCR